MPGLLDRAQDFLAERLNVAVLPAETVADLRESADRLEQFREEAGELAYHSLDYFSGRPQEWRSEKRKRLAQRARIALQGDPLAGAEADHYANFSLARGVSQPQAKDEAVQAVIDAGWGDFNNHEKLTGYDAQRALSHELKAGSNVFILAFIRGGRVRIGYLDADLVEDVITDPDDRGRVLWYTTRRLPKLKFRWANDSYDIDTGLGQDGLPKPMYYAHWRNLETARKERKEAGVEEKDWPEELRDPPADKLGSGVVYHVRTNRLLEQHFGVPVWARTLRFYTAMNRFLEARVAMAEASASFIARRVMRGGPKAILESAQSILRQTGEIGSRYEPSEGRQSTADASSLARPPRPGSFWTDNEASKLESLSLNSGAGNAVQDAQIIRGAAIAPSGFGQHLFGASENTNLATASALELPAMMAIQAWQEVLEEVFRWFTNLVIEAAVRAGKLGGAIVPADYPLAAQDISDLSLFEAEEATAIRVRTGKDLSYTFQMPYPGRRNLPDVVNAFGAVMGDPVASPCWDNEPLFKVMLEFLLTHGIEVEDPAGTAKGILERHAEVLKEKKALEAEQKKAELAVKAAPPVGGGAPRPVTRSPRPANGAAPHARTRGTTDNPTRMRALSSAEEWADWLEELEEQVWLPEDLRDKVRTFSLDAGELVRMAVTDPAVTATITRNGHAGPQEPPDDGDPVSSSPEG